MISSQTSQNGVFLNNMQHCLPWPQRFFLKFFFAKARASRIIIPRGTFHAEKKQTRLPECTGSHPKSGERESERILKRFTLEKMVHIKTSGLEK